MGLPYVELQTLVNSFVVSRSPGESSEGFEDLSFGIKVPVFAPEDGHLRISTLATLSLPTGSRFLTSDEAIPAATLLLDRTLFERWSLSANLGYTAGPGAQRDILSVTLTPSVSLPGGANLGTYAGYAGFFASGRDRHVVEAGLTVGATADLQLDVNGGLDMESGNYFVGIGFARRWGWP